MAAVSASSRRLSHSAWAPILLLAACAVEEPRVALRTGPQTAPVQVPAETTTIPVDFEMMASGNTGNVVTTGAGFTLLATVSSPVVDGVVVQATDVQWVGDRIVASYNNRGERSAGAIQIIDATDPTAPTVIAEAVYPYTDVNRLVVAGSRVLAVAAEEGVGATFERFTIADDVVTIDDHDAMAGFAGTYLSLDGNVAYTSFGDVGGIAAWDVSTEPPTLLRTIPLDDARWASEVDDDDLLAVSGSPGVLARHDNVLAASPGAITDVDIAGTGVGAPTWGTQSGDLLFLSSNEGGVMIYDVGSLALVGTMPTTGTANGAGLASDRRLLFAANGEEGLVVADVLDPSAPLTLGSIDVADDAGSANAVAVKDGLVALADGLGGVKIIRYEREQVAPPNDCDADGDPDEMDEDDDNDGTLDADDAAPCNPDRVCAEGTIEYQAGFIGDFYNLPCDHPDVEGPITGVVTGRNPSMYDWWDEPYYAFTVERDTLHIEYAENYFPVNEGLCGDPFYFAAHWYSTVVASEAGSYRFSMGSDDDGWLYVDGQLIVDLGGIHAANHRQGSVTLSAGAHRIDVWFAERHRVQSALELEIVGLPSPEARLEPIQKVCLDPAEDSDGDGTINADDVAPLTRPGD
jgi:fibro-slime domain-containing protein